MLPIAAPAIAAPAVAPASLVLAEGLLPGSAPAGSPTPGAAQSGVDPSIFALLLTPAPVAEPGVIPSVIPGEAAVHSDTGLAQLLSAFLGEAAEPSEDVAKDGELLALLASFGATAVPAQPAPSPAGRLDDILGEPLIASPAGPLPAATVDPLAPAMAAVSAPLPVPAASEGANDEAAPVVSTKLPTAPLAEAVAILPPSGQRIAPVAEQPAADAPLPAAMPVMVADVTTEAAQATAVVPAAPIVAAASTIADASRKAPALPSARTQAQPQSAVAAAPVADVEPTQPVDALTVVEPAMLVAASAELPKPKAAQAVADAIPATTPSPEQPILGMPAAAPPVASALPAAAPLPSPALAPSALVPQEAEAEAEADAIPAAPLAAAPAATAIATDASSLAVTAAPRAEPFAAVLRSEAAQPATSRTEPNPLERAVAHQVSRAIVQHLPDGGARMVMRLTPPELGTVRIEFISRDGMVTARLMAEDEGVRQALDRALPHIRAEVRGDHPTVDISVDRSDQRQAWGEGHARQERRDEPRAGQGRRRRDDEPLFSVDGVEPTVGPTPVRAAQQLGGRVGPTLVDALA